MAYFEALSRHLPGCCKEKHEKLWSIKPVPVFETGHSRIQFSKAMRRFFVSSCWYFHLS